MIQYYMELLNKPRYMLSSSEALFIDIFPYLVLGAILVVIVIGSLLIDLFKKHK